MMTQPLCAACGHPQSWHRHDDETCGPEHPQPCHPDTAPYRCLGYDCEAAGRPPREGTCDCLDFVDPDGLLENQLIPSALVHDPPELA